MSAISREFLLAIPKTDLHVHLDGSLRLSSLIEMARDTGVELPAWDEAGMRELVFKETYASLPEYLKGFQYTCAVMQNAENLERTAYEFAVDNLAENVRYVEVRFAPQLHINAQLDMEAVVQAVDRGLRRAEQEHNRSEPVRDGTDIPFHYGIILCALRAFQPAYSHYYGQLCQTLSYASNRDVVSTASTELARAAVWLAREKELPVVGFDLAGEEAGYPAVYHSEAFLYAHRHFLKKTVHAGEAYGPESIFQALTDCHANRIGHGTFLFAADRIRDEQIEDPDEYVKQLVDYLASTRITIEVNLTSNLQTTPSLAKLSDHPLRQMLDHSLSVTLCTDNRLVSNTTVTDELALAVEHLPIDDRRLRNMVIAGFKGSFFPGSYREKRVFVRKVIDRYEALESAWRD